MDYIKKINPDFIQRVCDYFALGTLKQARLIHKSLHWVWQIHTQTHCYALKILNPAIIAINNKDLIHFNKTQAIAETMQTFDVPTVVAFAKNQQYIVNIDNIACMLFLWLTGKSHFITTETAWQMGKILAKIHAAKFTMSHLPKPDWAGFSKQHWQDLLNNVQDSTITNRLADLIVWSEIASTARDYVKSELVVSHRDFDPKNVVWQNNAVLIDWDYAGLINATLELFIVALNWSNISLTGFDKIKFNAVCAGYRTIFPEVPAFSSFTVAGYAGYVLDWIEWNLRRIKIPGEEELAKVAIIYSIGALEAVMKNYQDPSVFNL